MSTSFNGGLTSILLLALLAWVLSFSYQEFAPLSPANIVRLAILVPFILYWMHVARRLAQPTAEQVALRAKRLQAAVALAGTTGVSEDWYSQAAQLISVVQVLLGTAAAALAVYLFVSAFPAAALAEVGTTLTALWDYLRTTFTEKTLFIYGILLCFLVPYYAVGLLFLALDLTRPRLLIPYKVRIYHPPRLPLYTLTHARSSHTHMPTTSTRSPLLPFTTAPPSQSSPFHPFLCGNPSSLLLRCPAAYPTCHAVSRPSAVGPCSGHLHLRPHTLSNAAAFRLTFPLPFPPSTTHAPLPPPDPGGVPAHGQGRPQVHDPLAREPARHVRRSAPRLAGIRGHCWSLRF